REKRAIEPVGWHRLRMHVHRLLNLFTGGLGNSIEKLLKTKPQLLHDFVDVSFYSFLFLWIVLGLLTVRKVSGFSVLVSPITVKLPSVSKITALASFIVGIPFSLSAA